MLFIIDYKILGSTYLFLVMQGNFIKLPWQVLIKHKGQQRSP